MTLQVSRPAPGFTATAVMPDNSVKEDFKLEDFRGKYVVLFFYPLDFTFVCPTEILEFNKKIADFEKRGVQVIGCSTDSHFSHIAWKEQDIKTGGIGMVKYPLIADFTKEVSSSYGVLLDGGMALRGSFLIDKEGILQHAVINNLPLGRNIDEMIRMVDALHFTEEHGEVCPANWTEGQDSMKDTDAGLKEYFGKNAAKYS
ncbi:MAG: peroxiredoxin [Leptospiraceae bacterium]|nr:peroxiredoxin [Leptospiraceae bacterium]